MIISNCETPGNQPILKEKLLNSNDIASLCAQKLMNFDGVENDEDVGSTESSVGVADAVFDLGLPPAEKSAITEKVYVLSVCKLLIV